MTTPTDDPVLLRFRRALDAIYGSRIERVVLFGSRARGDARAMSDYDIAVFLNLDKARMILDHARRGRWYPVDRPNISLAPARHRFHISWRGAPDAEDRG